MSIRKLDEPWVCMYLWMSTSCIGNWMPAFGNWTRGFWKKQCLLLTIEPSHRLFSTFLKAQVYDTKALTMALGRDRHSRIPCACTKGPHSLTAFRLTVFAFLEPSPDEAFLGVAPERGWQAKRKQRPQGGKTKRIQIHPQLKSGRARLWLSSLHWTNDQLTRTRQIPGCFGWSSLHFEWLLISSRWQNIHFLGII